MKILHGAMTKYEVNHVRTSARHPQTNGKIERFFQSLKYEFLCLFFLKNKKQLDGLLAEYLLYYNQFRLHEAINGRTPNAVFYDKIVPKLDKTSKQILHQTKKSSWGMVISGHTD